MRQCEQLNLRRRLHLCICSNMCKHIRTYMPVGKCTMLAQVPILQLYLFTTTILHAHYHNRNTTITVTLTRYNQ